ncbi:uncharacterized protein YebE (UPF0316 family) [Caldalkalibacillus uzonensis]|uniref:UPF0316 protein J2S00_002934 n=1 Tax=Caldalkalibacillus uzonensis TaxID=353224 RepID=A0ABU0CUY1_9BACI|nr:DUF2179 domain-containing protein [Caldalkalibacillus uzonensis]MDQ0340139.1 uncharacterized protein YebE (UPF0316 family) [Caldalkalibacillus uzonensis]
MVMMLIILVINVVYVSFFTIRMILTLKGQKYLASAISSIEVLIYVIGLGLVLENLNEIQNLIAYALGFALGVLAGSKIEEWMALGYVTVKVISNRHDHPLPQILREAGYGVTSWIGEGRDGKRLMMEILTRRKAQQDLYNHILAYDEKAFIISYEPQHFRGGFWVKSLKKQAKKEGETFHVVHEENLPGVDEKVIEEIRSEDDYADIYAQQTDKGGQLAAQREEKQRQ